MGPVGFSVEQQNLLWVMWRRGDSIREMERTLGETLPRIRRFLRQSGGIPPVPRQRRASCEACRPHAAHSSRSDWEPRHTGRAAHRLQGAISARIDQLQKPTSGRPRHLSGTTRRAMRRGHNRESRSGLHHDVAPGLGPAAPPAASHQPADGRAGQKRPHGFGDPRRGAPLGVAAATDRAEHHDGDDVGEQRQCAIASDSSSRRASMG